MAECVFSARVIMVLGHWRTCVSRTSTQHNKRPALQGTAQPSYCRCISWTQFLVPVAALPPETFKGVRAHVCGTDENALTRARKDSRGQMSRLPSTWIVRGLLIGSLLLVLIAGALVAGLLLTA